MLDVSVQLHAPSPVDAIPAVVAFEALLRHHALFVEMLLVIHCLSLVPYSRMPASG